VSQDLSLDPTNAIYELAFGSIVRTLHYQFIAGRKLFKFPFDLHSLLIAPYEHLGKHIDAEEADKVREDV